MTIIIFSLLFVRGPCSCNFYSHVYLPNYIVQPVFGKLVLFYYSFPQTKQKLGLNLPIEQKKWLLFSYSIDTGDDSDACLAGQRTWDLRIRNITTSPLQNEFISRIQNSVYWINGKIRFPGLLTTHLLPATTYTKVCLIWLTISSQTKGTLLSQDGAVSFPF